MIEESDEMIERVADALRPLPRVNDEAKARVLLAVAAERERDRETALRSVTRRARARWAASGAGLIAAGALAATLVLRVGSPDAAVPASDAIAPSALPAAAATLASATDASMDVVAVPVQLVFRAPEATRVAVVGDFNGWSKGANTMTRDSASGLWNATVLIRPGRHVYAFVVDDSVWQRDPRAVSAPDADFGRAGSVLLVGKP